MERFLSKFSEGPEDKCWIWKGSINSEGRGQFYMNGRLWCAPRLIYEYYYGDIPIKNICHICDNPSCVNPKHLADENQTKNMLDCMLRGRNSNFKISDVDALKLISEYNSKLFYAGEKTIWYNNKAILYNVSSTNIKHIIHGYRRKYLPTLEDEET